MTFSLGDSSDHLVVNGSAGSDSIKIGQSGIALNADNDRDITLTTLPAAIEVYGNGGVNALTGQGGSGAGTAFLGKVILHAGDSGDTLTGGSGDDALYGGAGADTLDGVLGNDVVSGGGGNDVVKGGVGDDDLTGDAGADQLIGSDGNDTLHADDDEADTNINGGPGTDTAYYDLGVDPTPLATENRIPA